MKEDCKSDRLAAASDVLVTKTNRLTVCEAAATGLPSVCVSTFVNWPDDVAVASVDSNTPLFHDSVVTDALSKLIVGKARSKRLPATELPGGVADAATRLRTTSWA